MKCFCFGNRDFQSQAIKEGKVCNNVSLDVPADSGLVMLFEFEAFLTIDKVRDRIRGGRQRSEILRSKSPHLNPKVHIRTLQKNTEATDAKFSVKFLGN